MIITGKLKTENRVGTKLKNWIMKNLNQPIFEEQLGAPKQLIKPVKIEEMIQNEKAVEALC